DYLQKAQSAGLALFKNTLREATPEPVGAETAPEAREKLAGLPAQLGNWTPASRAPIWNP
ncbi:MAG: hypothetical protein U1E06_05730, partial [Tabrizicola sp.]|nr:hypothetical protein [Tabrizicola sp.]